MANNLFSTERLLVAILIVVLARCVGQPAPSTETQYAMIGPIPTLTEGEKAAGALGQEYSNYKPTQAECDKAFESGEVEACVWPNSIQLIIRPEWEQLFPHTNFYVIGLTGRYQEPEYDYYRRTRLVAWQNDQRYTAETFDHLLAANGITEITDENRELVAKAFALMTIPDYLGEEVVFTEWEEVDWPDARHHYNHSLKAWTKIQGLEIWWGFVFEGSRLKIVTRGGISKHHTGDYIDVSFEALPLPPLKDYHFGK